MSESPPLAFKDWERIRIGTGAAAFDAYMKLIPGEHLVVSRFIDDLRSKLDRSDWALIEGNLRGMQPVTIAELLDAIDDASDLPQQKIEQEIWAVGSLDSSKLYSLARHVGFHRGCARESWPAVKSGLKSLLRTADSVGNWTASSAMKGVMTLRFLQVSDRVGFLELVERARSYNESFFVVEERREPWLKRMLRLNIVCIGHI